MRSDDIHRARIVDANYKDRSDDIHRARIVDANYKDRSKL